MLGTYNLSLVLLSLAVAVLASYTALHLAARMTASRGGIAAAWLVGGAIAMGFGIWSMHSSACWHSSCRFRWATTWR